MLYDYSVEKLKTLTLDFFNATGVNLIIFDSDFKKLNFFDLAFSNSYCKYIQDTPYGHKQCCQSDLNLIKKCKLSRQPEVHICHAGLIDIAVPIIFEFSIIGYIVLGQIKKNKNFVMPDSLKTYDADTLEKLYAILPFFDDEKVTSIINLATMLARFILVDEIIKPKNISALHKVIDFVNSNLEKELTISYISQETFVSVSVLYDLFHKHLNCTVGEYINRKRVEKSLSLLSTTDHSIKDIAISVGYNDPTYFSKKFKQIMGIRPIEYRKTAIT